MEHDGIPARHSRIFAARPDQAREARRFTAGVLAGDDRCDDLVLIVDELAANAVLHSRSGQQVRGTFEVTIVVSRIQVQVYVADAGPAESMPHIPEQRHAEPGGRGLLIVGELADNWGYDRTDAGGVTWCVLRGPGFPQNLVSPDLFCADAADLRSAAGSIR